MADFLAMVAKGRGLLLGLAPRVSGVRKITNSSSPSLPGASRVGREEEEKGCWTLGRRVGAGPTSGSAPQAGRGGDMSSSEASWSGIGSEAGGKQRLRCFSKGSENLQQVKRPHPLAASARESLYASMCMCAKCLPRSRVIRFESRWRGAKRDGGSHDESRGGAMQKLHAEMHDGSLEYALLTLWIVRYILRSWAASDPPRHRSLHRLPHRVVQHLSLLRG